VRLYEVDATLFLTLGVVALTDFTGNTIFVSIRSHKSLVK